MECSLRNKRRRSLTADELINPKEKIKMLVRAYLSICGLFVLAGLVVLATGNFTMMAAVVMGFIAFGLIFMGMISVLPAMVSHPSPPAPEKLMKVESMAIQPMRETPGRAFATLKSA